MYAEKDTKLYPAFLNSHLNSCLLSHFSASVRGREENMLISSTD